MQPGDASTNLNTLRAGTYGMGTGSLSTSISRNEIARIHAFWARPNTPFVRTEN